MRPQFQNNDNHDKNYNHNLINIILIIRITLKNHEKTKWNYMKFSALSSRIKAHSCIHTEDHIRSHLRPTLVDIVNARIRSHIEAHIRTHTEDHIRSPQWQT